MNTRRNAPNRPTVGLLPAILSIGLLMACSPTTGSPPAADAVQPADNPEPTDAIASAQTTGRVSAQLSDNSPAALGTLIRVEIEPCTGLGRQRATALAIGPDIALTAAHSFESAEAVTLRFADAAGHEVTVEALLESSDIEKDIALIKPAVPLDQPWNAFVLGEPQIGESATIETYADIDGPETKQAEVRRLVNATLDGEGRRAAIELGADIDPGDSGAPVLSSAGRAIGMVFASSRTSDRGWAVRSNELAEAVDAYAATSSTSAGDGVGFECPPAGG